jgi:hypothetical protein
MVVVMLLVITKEASLVRIHVWSDLIKLHFDLADH